MAETATDPLLEKVYFDDCPGCKVDRWKEKSTSMPVKQFLYVWLVTLAGALPISSLFPFVYFMVRDLNIAKSEEDIGFYAGYIGSSFMFGRTLTSFLWGVIADKYGRKPVIFFGIGSVIILNTLLGLSVNFWTAIAARFLLGSLNGLLGPIKAYSLEISPPQYQATALSLIITSWGMGLIIGPAVGGYLAQPADKFPHLFPKESIFGRFPYFLPCLCISLFAVGVFILCFSLPETLHTHKAMKEYKPYDSLAASENGSASNVKKVHVEGKNHSSDKNLFNNWPLMSSIIVYCVFSFHDMAYTETFSLWAESDKKYGGLGFSSNDVGEVLAVSGFSLLVVQTFLYPSIVKCLGPVVSSRMAGVMAILLLSMYPIFAKLFGIALLVVVNLASLLKNVLSMIAITGMTILQNNAVEQHRRGAANGISLTLMSLFKTVAPAAGGTVFSWAQRRQSASFLPGDQLVFFFLNLVELLGVLLTFRPFLDPSN
ncbi:protein ZINC INDUCED FACILITATOR-LIKE 1-like [Wolffia australiana]